MNPSEIPVVPACHDDVCVTCSDEAVPVVVSELRAAGLALADTGSGAEEISIALVDARVGDTVLVHAGEAIARVDDPGGSAGSGSPQSTVAGT